MRAAYDAATLVAMPSLWGEPFGLVGIEAFARGRPVVAYDAGAISEWLCASSGGGRVVPLGDEQALAQRNPCAAGSPLPGIARPTALLRRLARTGSTNTSSASRRFTAARIRRDARRLGNRNCDTRRRRRPRIGANGGVALRESRRAVVESSRRPATARRIACAKPLSARYSRKPACAFAPERWHT